jgi:hypothetical protein
MIETAILCAALAQTPLIDVEFRVANDVVLLNEQVIVDVYLVSDPAHVASAAEINFVWDTDYVTLVGADESNSPPMFAFPDFPDFLPQNEATPPADGDAKYIALAAGGDPFESNPAGVYLVSFVFDATGLTTSSQIAPVEYAPCCPTSGPTIVFDGEIPAYDITGELVGDCFAVLDSDCPWDLNGDGTVNIQDFGILNGHWGCPFNNRDFLDLIAAWGDCP